MNGPQHETPNDGNGAEPTSSHRSILLRTDDIVGGVILLFCAVVYGITTTFEKVPAMLSQGIQPTQFPRLLLGVIALLAIIMIYQSRRKEDAVRKAVPPVALVSAGLLCLFAAAIDWVGALAAIFLFCLILPVLWGERRYKWIAAIAVLFPLCIYLLFTKMLEVRFPLGIFDSIRF